MRVKGRLWTPAEIEAAVNDYCTMLLNQERGEKYSKAQHYGSLGEKLKRSKASIEMRHQNISAALIRLGLPWIDGYKPLNHGESRVLPYVAQRVAADRALTSAIAQAVTAPVPQDVVAAGHLKLVAPPRREPAETSHESRGALGRRRGPRINYLEREAHNSAVGRAGELLVIRFERQRLKAARRPDLARKVAHVALDDDGAGYDVLSFDEDEIERFIEVKTTAYGAETPFFVSRAERDISVERDRQYQLYRVFRLRSGPNLFTLRGPLTRICRLDPALFSASVA